MSVTSGMHFKVCFSLCWWFWRNWIWWIILCYL